MRKAANRGSRSKAQGAGGSAGGPRAPVVSPVAKHLSPGFSISDEAQCSINGMPFTPRSDCEYLHDYVLLAKKIKTQEKPEQAALRALMRSDLWALLYFGLRVTIANHPWWVNCANEVQLGPKTDTVDLWARDHGKSTIITIGETVQDILKNPDERVCIYSYTKSTAQMFLKPIREHLGNNPFLVALFPDILWEDLKDAPQWNEDAIIVKRSAPMKESTVEAWGLTEGQPTGRHFTKRVYDDIETPEIADSPRLTQIVKDRFDMSQNTGCEGGRMRVIGTPYKHNGVLQYVLEQKRLDGEPMYLFRKKPATDDGTATGRPVWLSQGELDKKRVNPRMFRSQQLIDVTPKQDERLPWEHIHQVSKSDLPSRLVKLMMVDPAGTEETRADGRTPDSWAIFVIGVDPFINDLGASKVFIMDGFLGTADWDDGMKQVVNIYLRNGFINRLGVEKVGMSSAEIHVSRALRAKGRIVTLENKMLAVLQPKGRKKHDRIEANLGPPLRSGLVHILDTVPVETKNALKEQLEKYPMWKDDGPDCLAYGWDLMKEYHFPREQAERPAAREDLWKRLARRRRSESRTRSWQQ